ncbi:MAG: endolytic transglycosylase MltG, partial [Clostridiales bacterium]
MTNSKDKKLRLPIILFLVLLLFVAIYVGATAILHQISMAVTINETVSITIEPGSGTAAIAEKLEEAGLIRNQRYFRSYVAKSGIDASLKAGAFIFQAGEWSVEQVAQLLAAGSNGPVDDTKVTIPEGLKVSQIARIFANAGLADYDAFMDYCS